MSQEGYYIYKMSHPVHIVLQAMLPEFDFICIYFDLALLLTKCFLYIPYSKLDRLNYCTRLFICSNISRVKVLGRSQS